MFPLMVLGCAAWVWFWRRVDRRRAVDRDLQYDCDRQPRKPGGHIGKVFVVRDPAEPIRRVPRLSDDSLDGLHEWVTNPSPPTETLKRAFRDRQGGRS